MSKKHVKVCETLNYVEHVLFLASTIIGYIWISTFLLWFVFLKGLRVLP